LIDTQAIRGKLLDLAMSGALTIGYSAEETAEELFQSVQKKKQELISAGKIKRDNPLPAIADDEIPFTIPCSWKWIRWGDIVNIVSARRVHQADWRKSGVPFYRAREIAKLADNGFVNNDLFISEELFNEFSKSGVPHENDLMVSAVGTLGKTYVVRKDDRFYYKDASVLCFENFGGINPHYLALAMKSDMMRRQIGSNSGGTTVDTLTMVRMVKYLLPLPPLSEQSEIVDRIHTAFSILSTIDELQAQYADNLTVLKGKLIDAAIQGKLTQQLPEDGTAEELYQLVQEERQRQEAAGTIKAVELAPAISDSDKPFSIPASWKWTNLGNVSYIVRGGSPRPIKQYITTREDGINWIKIGDVEKGGKYIYSTHEKIIPEGESKSRRVYPGDFLLTNSMSFGRPYISKIEGCIHDGWLLIHGLNGFNPDYLYYLLSSTYLYGQFTVKASGSTVDNLNIDKVKAAIIPLPPLAEQKRIAQKIDELMPIFDR